MDLRTQEGSTYEKGGQSHICTALALGEAEKKNRKELGIIWKAEGWNLEEKVVGQRKKGYTNCTYKSRERMEMREWTPGCQAALKRKLHAGEMRE